MPDELQPIHDVAVLLCAPDGQVLRTERDAMDIISEALHHGASWVVIPTSRLDDAFFQVRTRIAGDIIQKFVNYRCGIAIVGDISRYTATSSALRDFVRESNRGTQVWFLPDVEGFCKQLERIQARLHVSPWFGTSMCVSVYMCMC